MKRLVLLLLLLTLPFGSAVLFAQHFGLPEDLKVNKHADFSQYSPYILPAIDWLQETPLNVEKKRRYQVDNFIIYWLEKNPDITLSVPDYVINLQSINNEFLFLFMSGWIKHILQEKDHTYLYCNLAGLNSVLNYYKSGKGVPKNEYLDELVKIQNEGRLKKLFDSANVNNNTVLCFKPPYKKHSFRYDENYFDFHFYCVNLIHPKSIRYRYKLDGYYDGWIPTTDEDVTYPRLPPGSYTFIVQASANEDFSHALESRYSFTVSTPLWKQTWFIAAMLLACVLLVYLYIKQREANQRKLAALKQERIMFEYEHLKSQVDPHFLFNSLNTLTNLIAKDPKKAISYTEHLSELYHNILAYHDNDFVLLADEFSILNLYITIQKGRFGNALQLNVDIPDELMRSKKVVPLALQLLIENAIKHNVVSASRPLVINITANEEELTVKNVIQPKISKEKSTGLGLENISRRYSLLTNKQVTYGVVNNEFVITLPLL
ncbi:MAG: histidine kinase [Flavipsychrobacter sp.]